MMKKKNSDTVSLQKADENEHQGVVMDLQEVRWEHYPHVADHAVAHAFIERLVLKGKRPKTVDAYARAIEDLLAYFAEGNPSRARLCVKEGASEPQSR